MRILTALKAFFVYLSTSWQLRKLLVRRSIWLVALKQLLCCGCGQWIYYRSEISLSSQRSQLRTSSAIFRSTHRTLRNYCCHKLFHALRDLQAAKQHSRKPKFPTYSSTRASSLLIFSSFGLPCHALNEQQLSTRNVCRAHSCNLKNQPSLSRDRTHRDCWRKKCVHCGSSVVFLSKLQWPTSSQDS